MELELVYDAADAVPEAFKDLYTEKDGKFSLTGVKGMKTQADIDRLTSALNKERGDHKSVKDSWRPLADRNMKVEDIIAALDKVPELEATIAASKDPKGLEDAVEARLKGRLAPVERERDGYKTKLAEAEAARDAAVGALTSRDITDEVRAAATKAKVVDTALEDIMLLASTQFEKTEDGRIVQKESGLDATAWLNELKEKRPHWWPASQGGGANGGGAGGGGGANPWSASGWNVTAQGAVVREKGREYAERLATAAGSFLGSPRPPVKK